jgi:hypothetical protein
MELILLLASVPIFIAVYISIYEINLGIESKQKKIFDEQFSKKGYNFDNIFFYHDLSRKISKECRIDIKNKKILFIDLFSMEIKEFNFDDIINIQEIKNGICISSGLQSTILGGVIGGEIGMVVGSNLSDKVETFNSYGLRILTKDISNPMYEFLIVNYRIKSNSKQFLFIKKFSMQIISTMQSIEVQRDQLIKSNFEDQLSDVTINEIEKYKKLLDEAIITKEEFYKRRNEILGLNKK